MTINRWVALSLSLSTDVDGVQCQGTLVSRGSQLDWLRYGWDMLTDEGLSITDLMDIYDAADPRSWDKDDNSVGSHGSTTTVDDVIVRWEAAADAVGFGAAHDDQKSNGLDH